MSEIIRIDDSTRQLPVNPLDCAGYVQRDFSREPQGIHGFAAPFAMELIPRSEWADRIRDMERNKTRLSDIMADAAIPSESQGYVNDCWAACVVDAIIVLRAVAGKPHIPLSPASVAGPATKYRNWSGRPAGVGGWTSQALKYVVEHGIATAETWPANDLNPKWDNADSQASRSHHGVTEWWDGSSDSDVAFAQMMTCVFNRLPVPGGYPWMSHAVDAIDPIMDARGTTFGVRVRNTGLYRDKYGMTELLGSRAMPSEIVAPRVTSPIKAAA